MLTFAAAVFFLIITPGPGVMSLAGVGAAFGRAAGLRYLTGLFIGHNAVALATALGLVAVILTDARLRTVLAILSMGYLLYLTAKIAFAGTKVALIEADRPPGILGGLALQAINPKAYTVNAFFFTGFAFLPQNLTLEILIKFLIFNAIWVPIHLLWLWLGIALRRLNLPGKTQRMINIGMALAMLVVVGLAAWSLLGRG